MEKKYVLAIDQSTQGTKAIIFDENGDLCCRTDLPHKQIVNDKGWVSHDLDEIYKNTIQVVKNLVEKAGIEKSQIACLGISNQRETSAAWEKTTGKPLAYAIVWQCSRAEDICERIKKYVIVEEDREADNVAELIRLKTGINMSAYFPAAKFAWLQENESAVRQAKREGNLCFGTIDSYLLYRLTKGEVHGTDYSNASRTQLFNIHTLAWDEEICTWFGIRKEELPTVMDSSAEYGVTDFEGYFDTPIPICGVIGDSQGALFGQGGTSKGKVKATYGTGSSIMMNVGNECVVSDKGLVTSLAWGIDGTVTYVLEGNINYSGAVITWLKDDMKLIDSPMETQALAEAANPKDTTYLVPAFSGLGAPYWRPSAKAIIYGMSRTTGKNEIVRAALDSIAYQISDVVNAMCDDQTKVEELCVDGGPTKNAYLMQFQSDILNTKVKTPRCEESSALGAAFMAGLAAGFYQIEQVTEMRQTTCYESKMGQADREEKYNGWKQALIHVM